MRISRQHGRLSGRITSDGLREQRESCGDETS